LVTVQSTEIVSFLVDNRESKTRCAICSHIYYLFLINSGLVNPSLTDRLLKPTRPQEFGQQLQRARTEILIRCRPSKLKSPPTLNRRSPHLVPANCKRARGRLCKRRERAWITLRRMSRQSREEASYDLIDADCLAGPCFNICAHYSYLRRATSYSIQASMACVQHRNAWPGVHLPGTRERGGGARSTLGSRARPWIFLLGA